MWTTLALVAALSTAPDQADALKLTNVRATYGPYGVTRKNDKVIPGDMYYLYFDIEGLSMEATGRMRYSMDMKVVDSKGKRIFGSQQADERQVVAALGGNRLPGVAYLLVKPDQEPGEYTMTVVVTDRAAKASQTLTRKIEILEKSFAMVGLNTSVDANGTIIVPASGAVGESRYVNFAVVGFERDPRTKQPDVSLVMHVFDENGKETLPKPFAGEVTDNVKEKDVAIPANFLLDLTRPGKFAIELVAKDRVSKKEHTLRFSLTVSDPWQGKAAE
jgi:hypothetical protein